MFVWQYTEKTMRSVATKYLGKYVLGGVDTNYFVGSSYFPGYFVATDLVVFYVYCQTNIDDEI